MLYATYIIFYLFQIATKVYKKNATQTSMKERLVASMLVTDLGDTICW